jgi:hypothetical protein
MSSQIDLLLGLARLAKLALPICYQRQRTLLRSNAFASFPCWSYAYWSAAIDAGCDDEGADEHGEGDAKENFAAYH